MSALSATILLLLITVATVTGQPRPYYNYYYQDVPASYSNQAYRTYNSYQQYPHVVHNVVQDRIWGGPTSLGWAQVPRHLSPMFSPVFGRK